MSRAVSAEPLHPSRLAPRAATPQSPAQGRLVADLPALFALLLLTLGAALGPSRGSHVAGAAAALLVAHVLVRVSARRGGRTLAVSIDVRKQHYLQAVAQGAVFLYWGWYWRPVYEFVPLLTAQVLFAYTFDMLLVWSRRPVYSLGYGPIPVVFSTNLFLWFKPEWFFLQFAMLAVGFAAKELLKWHRDGRVVHIFNPSSFPLAVVSVALIAAGGSHVTRGQEMAITQFYPPQMYLWLFLVALPGQFFFGVASMTLSAVLTTYVLGLLYFAATGTYLFLDSYVPIAVFLGMHLLFTDPSTSPRTELGRLIFGGLYGASSMLLYLGLGAFGVPAFYDKLLQVPLLNLSVRWIDRRAGEPWLRHLDPTRLGRSLAPRQRHLAYMTLWAAVFVTLSAVDGLGDRHAGQWLPFWDRACQQGRPRACAYRATLQQILCDAGSGWACNEYGALLQPARRPEVAGRSFRRACDLGFQAGCDNLDPTRAEHPVHAPPTLDDYRIVLRGRKGPLPDLTPLQLYERACVQGFDDGCRLAETGHR